MLWFKRKNCLKQLLITLTDRSSDHFSSHNLRDAEEILQSRLDTKFTESDVSKMIAKKNKQTKNSKRRNE